MKKSTSSQAGSHAKTYLRQVLAMESTENEAGCGQRCSGWLAKYDPDTHSLKTAQCSLLEDSMLSSVILPKWGTMRGGELLALEVLGGHINETGYGLLETPVKNEGPGSMMLKLTDRIGILEGFKPRYHFVKELQHLKPFKGKVSVPLGELMMDFPCGWTGLQPLEMHKFQQWQLSHI